MQQLITEKQARQITGGRKPLVPICFEEAMAALEKCISIEDSQYWADAADALSAWAKIYHDDEASRKAKVLKLTAYRHMGELAQVLRPKKTTPKGEQPGPLSMLVETGLPRDKAKAARYLGKLSPEKFSQLVNQKNPLSPQTVLTRRDAERSWVLVRDPMMYLSTRMGKEDFAALAKVMTPAEKERAHFMMRRLEDLFNVFRECLEVPDARSK